jgi:hypothetical protein
MKIDLKVSTKLKYDIAVATLFKLTEGRYPRWSEYCKS